MLETMDDGYDEELKYWLALNNVEGLGPRHFGRLLKYFGGDAERAWKATPDELATLNFTPTLRNNFRRTQKTLNINTQLTQLAQLGVQLIRYTDQDYPPLLKQIADPPYLLYVRGGLKPQDKLALAIVGSRRMTQYGREVLKNLVPDLVAQNLTIVSGLALGTDAYAHKTALDADGRTIAVLASGVDSITPVSNQYLAERIFKEDRGAIISELPLGTIPQKSFFPVRNRIISGFGLGTLFVEATENSGTAHTARAALEQGREVFAVPGSIFSRLSIGPHRLIKDGAKMVNDVDDILEELNLKARGLNLAAQKIIPESAEEEVILKILGDEELHVDRIIQNAGLGASAVMSTLTMMEMTGKVVNLGGQTYRVKR
jgi:DNA processing protein